MIWSKKKSNGLLLKTVTTTFLLIYFICNGRGSCLFSKNTFIQRVRTVWTQKVAIGKYGVHLKADLISGEILKSLSVRYLFIMVHCITLCWKPLIQRITTVNTIQKWKPPEHSGIAVLVSSQSVPLVSWYSSQRKASGLYYLSPRDLLCYRHHI